MKRIASISMQGDKAGKGNKCNSKKNKHYNKQYKLKYKKNYHLHPPFLARFIKWIFKG